MVKWWWTHRQAKRRDRDQLAVLAAVASGTRYGIELMKRLGLGSARVYVALAMLQRTGLVGSRMELESETDRSRRLYELTDKGRRYLGDIAPWNGSRW